MLYDASHPFLSTNALLLDSIYCGRLHTSSRQSARHSSTQLLLMPCFVHRAGVARTVVEFRALYKCTQAAMKHDKQLVRNSLLCCYALPFIMTLQSMSVLLVLGLVFPYWILHICVVAFCVWGPPAMIALMTTAWQPDRHRVSMAATPHSYRPVVYGHA